MTNLNMQYSGYLPSITELLCMVQYEPTITKLNPNLNSMTSNLHSSGLSEADKLLMNPISNSNSYKYHHDRTNSYDSISHSSNPLSPTLNHNSYSSSSSSSSSQVSPLYQLAFVSSQFAPISPRSDYLSSQSHPCSPQHLTKSVKFTTTTTTTNRHLFPTRKPSTVVPMTNRSVFRCDKCPSVFSRKNSLKRHGTIHLDTRPYECTACQRSFNRYDIYSRHRKSKRCQELRNHS